jgi:hypothetical protein
VRALLTKLARDREADAALQAHAQRCWHNETERRASAEALAKRLLGFRGLGAYLEGCFSQTWNAKSGWLDVPTRIFWAHRWEPGQTFRAEVVSTSTTSSVGARPCRPFRVTLTRSQVRHVPEMRSWARRRFSNELRTSGQPRRIVTAELNRLDRWMAARYPRDRSGRLTHGRRALFTEEWWAYADWVYRHYGKREKVSAIALRNTEREDAPGSWGDPSYISRKQRAFVKAGNLAAIGRPNSGAIEP